MAIRTGVSELDALLDEFARCHPELEDTEAARGRCLRTSHRFLRFLMDKGIDHAWEWTDTIDEFQYDDRPHESADDFGVVYDMHTAIVVPWGEVEYVIDWTAVQFGYEQWPLVQRLVGGVTLEREWRPELSPQDVFEPHIPPHDAAQAEPELGFG